MNLQGLIDLLAAAPDAPVVFDFGCAPFQLGSWRGSYDELTLYHSDGDDTRTTRALLADATAADGKAYRGYNGGEYTMTSRTPVWADDYGECCYRAIVGSRVDDTGRLVLVTGDLSEYR